MIMAQSILFEFHISIIAHFVLSQFILVSILKCQFITLSNYATLPFNSLCAFVSFQMSGNALFQPLAETSFETKHLLDLVRILLVCLF